MDIRINSKRSLALFAALNLLCNTSIAKLSPAYQGWGSFNLSQSHIQSFELVLRWGADPSQHKSFSLTARANKERSYNVHVQKTALQSANSISVFSIEVSRNSPDEKLNLFNEKVTFFCYPDSYPKSLIQKQSTRVILHDCEKGSLTKDVRIRMVEGKLEISVGSRTLLSAVDLFPLEEGGLVLQINETVPYYLNLIEWFDDPLS